MSANQPARLIMLMLLSLLLISYGVGNIRCSTVPGNWTDMLSLLDFKAVTNDPTHALSSWNSNIPHCHWKGVRCSPTHQGRVTALNLTGQNLQGQIAPSLGNLTFLRKLDLTSNGFFGQLPTLNRLHRLRYLYVHDNKLQGFNPDALINCYNLQYLDLSVNSIMGSLPQKIGLLSNLVYLTLHENSFTGIIPSSLQNITQLVSLTLHKNSFTGIIPSSLQNITQLEDIYLSDNQLQGSIPEELGQLSNMQELFLGVNRLSGRVPTSVLNHSTLAILDLNSNFLQMELPSNIGDTLPSLQLLALNNNTFQGRIPASLGKPQRLQIVDLASNNFSGQVPSTLGRLSDLNFLKLDNNKLEANDSQSWEFLDALSNCRYLQSLFLQDNQLQGAIPNSIGNLSPNLQYLELDGNKLLGTVPESIGNLTGLIWLSLAQNNLVGPIGSWIGNLKNLGILNLSVNNFAGPIPSSIGGLTKLTQLFLYENKFEGPIPQSLGNLPSLLVMNLSHNNLIGHIPEELFSPVSTMTTCSVSYNNLEGPIPPVISNLKHLTELHVSSNKLSGEIPASLGECQELLILQMESNFLTGSIPKSLISLKSLSMLNLSHNNLSGPIPTELSHLSSLTQLDLSYNNLQGEIPRDGVFKNAANVSLGGNWGLCGGILDLHMPSCSAASGRKIEYYLVRVLIPVFGFMSLVLLIYFLVTEKKMTRQPYFSLFPLGQQFPKVSYKDLAEATQNFAESNLVGRGGYGSVYRGKLIQDKLEVAVKVLDLDMRGAEKSFLSECKTLRGIRHRNLVPIITACSTVDLKGSVFKALVYEFMPNGNLDTWLHHKEDGKATKALDLTQRTCFALNIADALDYLHNESGRTIIHCDVKPSNILLDDDMNAHLGDFGIANFYRDSKSTSTGDTSSIGVKGTIGYIAPEYARGGRASTCGDVYSFGIVLLEMVTGKRPTDPSFVNELNIVSFVERNFPDQILHVIDTPLQAECKAITEANMVTENGAYQCLFALLQVALSCTRQFPSERMTMREAASKISVIKTAYAGGKPKNASVR